jgi:hypothetical protein
MKKLKTLNLSENPFRIFDENVFDNLKALEVLKLRSCGFFNENLQQSSKTQTN